MEKEEKLKYMDEVQILSVASEILAEVLDPFSEEARRNIIRLYLMQNMSDYYIFNMGKYIVGGKK